MINYEIFADVSIDIDKQFAKENQVRFVPMEYMLGEETFHCAELESDETMHNYYEKLRKKVPTRTSQISPYHYRTVFEPYVKEQRALLYLCLSSGLSDTYASANMAVEMLKEDYDQVEIEIVDSLGATGGMGLLAESACKNRAAGMSLAENAQWLREQAKKIYYWFEVEDLMYLKRGGRVSAATAVVGTALNIKPVLTINGDGKLDTVAKKRGTKMALRYMVEQFEANFDASAGNVVYSCGADCPKDAQDLKKMLLEKHPDLEVRLTMLSPIIGAHTGPDMLSLIYYGKTAKK
ncbi:MAG: DegV family protein [Lachnospiraceae bacterium]